MPSSGSICPPPRPRGPTLARWLLSACLALTLSFGQAVAADEPDVRVLIDVSGSMKANDPQNLRVPAVKLLVDLLPDRTRAGIWTFAKFVNMQVRHGVVDRNWRKRAGREAHSIHSRGLFTDIEQALERATRSWGNTPGKHPRHLILLTDGVVDVPGPEGASADSRERIIEKLLPRIRAAGARIHTVGLSQNVDEALLVQLATATQGQYNQIEDAGVLQRVFLRLFEQAAQTDALPLADNAFTVDASVNELTLVVFRAGPDTDRTRVTPPEGKGKTFSVEDAPPGVRWRSDEGYDLITIPEPATGKWRIDAAVDPDNRAMVVTDLKLRTGDLPAFAMPDTPLPIEAHLSDGEQIIDRAAFLDKVLFLASARSADDPALNTEVELSALEDPDAAGHYRGDLTTGDTAAEIEVLIQVDGGTFVREVRRRIRIDWPASAYILGLDAARAAQAEDDPSALEPLVLEVTANSSLVDVASVSVSARVVAPSGEETTIGLDWQGPPLGHAQDEHDPGASEPESQTTQGAGGGDASVSEPPNPTGSPLPSTGTLDEVAPVWMGTLPVPVETEDHQVLVDLRGNTVAGDPFEVTLAPMMTPGMTPAPEPEAPIENVEAEAPPEPVPATEEDSVAEALDPRWPRNLALAGALNLLAIGVGVGMWWWSRRRSRREMNEFMEAVQWSK